MPRNKPPFRADVVGSLLRTAALKQARAKREKGEIDAAKLNEVENREIEKIIRKQEGVGLKVATDGEFRRSWWHLDFYGMLDGVEIYELDHGINSTACRPSRAASASKASWDLPVTRCWSISSFSRRTPASCRKCASRIRPRCISA